VAHGEEQQRYGKQAVDTEHGRVGVNRCGVDPLGEVEDDGRVDQEAEHTGAHEVPEGHGDEKVDRPLVGIVLPARLDHPQVVHDLEPKQGERDDLQRGKDRTQCDDRRRGPCPVEVVKGSDHTAPQIQEDDEVGCLECKLLAHRTDSCEQESHHNGCKNLEEPFHPEVNHPPPPVLRVGHVAPLSVHQSGHVEERNAH